MSFWCMLYLHDMVYCAILLDQFLTTFIMSLNEANVVKHMMLPFLVGIWRVHNCTCLPWFQLRKSIHDYGVHFVGIPISYPAHVGNKSNSFEMTIDLLPHLYMKHVWDRSSCWEQGKCSFFRHVNCVLGKCALRICAMHEANSALLWSIFVIPKDGLTGPRLPILLLVWQQQRSLCSFSHDTAHVGHRKLMWSCKHQLYFCGSSEIKWIGRKESRSQMWTIQFHNSSAGLLLQSCLIKPSNSHTR